MKGEKVIIIHERDHYEVWVDDEFFCSADSVSEAVREYEEWYGAFGGAADRDSD
jgi:hypothetical protein